MPSINWSHFSRYTYAFIDPAVSDHKAILRAALLSEAIPDSDLLCILPSSMGADTIVFARPADREATTDGEPILVMEHTVRFERPEEVRNWFCFEHSGFTTIALEDYPIEHWNRHHMEVALGAMVNPFNIT